MPSEEYLKSRIAVLESKWFEHRNTSIRDLFNFLSELRYENHHGYRYEMFGGVREFKEVFKRMAGKNGIHYLYVATHGDNDSLSGAMGSSISRAILANCIKNANDNRGKLVGLYLGNCLFGSPGNLQNLISKGTKICWIAGYKFEVGFIKSSVFDLLFFNTLLEFRKDENMTEIKAIKETAAKLQNEVSGLIIDLGFSLYLWERDKNIQLI